MRFSRDTGHFALYRPFHALKLLLGKEAQYRLSHFAFFNRFRESHLPVSKPFEGVRNLIFAEFGKLIQRCQRVGGFIAGERKIHICGKFEGACGRGDDHRRAVVCFLPVGGRGVQCHGGMRVGKISFFKERFDRFCRFFLVVLRSLSASSLL